MTYVLVCTDLVFATQDAGEEGGVGSVLLKCFTVDLNYLAAGARLTNLTASSKMIVVFHVI